MKAVEKSTSNRMRISSVVEVGVYLQGVEEERPLHLSMTRTAWLAHCGPRPRRVRIMRGA
jgi:hypothetical protein